ncbi:aminoglycoside phosphotransferase [Frateuria sp. Soil773]|uniref:phosphotransferase enzyme family protein n=1 Tax=Frateuria sp. Soil773 TaxID=1736407 RepID=UPI0006FA0467|nr:phosphotransferase [Frateuria sp. Soil773]KRE92470.1 aminoglycoside phosphotransferase [Frateuria sp. Soil773]
MTEPDHRVHGLADDDVAPDWPPLDASELDALLGLYPGLAPRGAIRWHSPRPLSAACLVDTPHGTLFVKRHHSTVRSAAVLAEEHAYMDRLRAAGVPVPRVLADRAGRTAPTLGEWTYEVHERAEGIDLYRHAASWTPLRDLGQARSAGAMLARVHAAAEGYAAPQRGTHLLVARSELIEAADPPAALEAQLPHRPGLAEYLARRDWRAELAAVFAPFHAAVQPQLARQPRLWTHGDWHVSNLCWSGSGSDARITAVLDFGLAARTFALFDLATAIERNAVAWLALDAGDRAVHADTAQALVAGYRGQRPLDARDVRLLADLLPLAHVDFALSEVEYFSAVTGSPANADVAYHTFLRGHAAWFATPPGRALQQAIRDLA